VKKFLYLVVLASILMLWHYHGNPFSGYLAFSEAFYSAEAGNYKISGILVPQVEGRIDHNVPPLYTILNYIVFRSAQLPGNTRALNILFHVLNVLLVCEIARKTSGDLRTGVIAAMLYATLPITSILAVTVIPETFWMTLLLTGYLLYLHELYLVAFSVLSLAMFTKQPTVILGLILIVHYYKKRRSVSLSVAFFCLMLAVLAAFYLLHFAMYGTQFLDDIRERAGVARLPGIGQLTAMGSEFMFAGMFTSIIMLFSVVLGTKRGLNWIVFWAYIAFFIVYHHHSYYVFPAMVFGILVISDNFRLRRFWQLAVAGLVITNLLFSLNLLSRNRPPSDLLAGIECREVTASDDFVEYWWPVWRNRCPEHDVLTCAEAAESAEAGRTCIGFWECDAVWSNPNWFRPANGRCELSIRECECPITDGSPTLKWSDYIT